MKRILTILSSTLIGAGLIASAAQAKVTLDVQYPYAFVFDKVMVQLKDEFEKQNPDVTINYRAPYKSYEGRGFLYH